MVGSPSSILMLGLGNGTFNGSPSLVLTGGYGIGEASVVVQSIVRVPGRRTTVTAAGSRTTITAKGDRTGEV